MASKVKDILTKFEKRYSGSTELVVDYQAIRSIPVLKTGSPIINAVAGIGGIPRGRVTEIYGPYSSGKGHPPETKVLALRGEVVEGSTFTWQQIGDLQVGDHLMSPTGAPTMVTGVFDHLDKRIFRIAFNDGSSIKCDEQHLWPVVSELKGAALAYKVLPMNMVLEMFKEARSIQIPNLWGFVDLEPKEVKDGEALEAGLKGMSWDGVSPSGMMDQPALSRLMFLRAFLVGGEVPTELVKVRKPFTPSLQEIGQSLGAIMRVIPDTSELEFELSQELRASMRTVTDIQELQPGPSRCVSIDHPLGLYIAENWTVTHNTTIATELAVDAQRSGGVTVYVDFEHALSLQYARQLGLKLDPETFILVQPDYFEQGADIVLALVEEDLVDLVVFDSAAAMTPKSEMEGDMDKDGGGQKGTQAALMAKLLARLTKGANRGRKPAIVIINQTRAVISIGGPVQKNAPKEQSAAGNAIKFYSSMRLELAIVTPEGDENRGTKGTDQLYTQNRVRITAIKNKLAPPWVRGTFVIEYGTGINNELSVLELADAKLGLIGSTGWVKLDTGNPETSYTGRGKEAFMEELKKRPKLYAYIEGMLVDYMRKELEQQLGTTLTTKDAKVITEQKMVLSMLDDPTDLAPDPGVEKFDGPGLPIE